MHLEERTKILLPIEWNLIRLGGPPHGIATKTVHKTLLGCGGGGGLMVLGVFGGLMTV